jgi:hypothetical protein
MEDSRVSTVTDLPITRPRTDCLTPGSTICSRRETARTGLRQTAAFAVSIPTAHRGSQAGRRASRCSWFMNPAPEKMPTAPTALAEDPSGNVWCGSYGGLYRLQRSAQNVAFEWVDIGLPRNAYLGQLVNNIAVDGAGGLWIAARHGLFRRSRDGQFERYTTAHGLPDNVVEVVYQDHGGSWWIGTRGRGFCSMVSDPRPDRRAASRLPTRRILERNPRVVDADLDRPGEDAGPVGKSARLFPE